MQMNSDNRSNSYPVHYATQLLKLNLMSISKWFYYAYQQLTKVSPFKDEPLIQTQTDRKGNQYWQVFDPVTKDTFCFDSENDVRIWLERRYC
ncbi:MAG: hypothetical protein Kow00121_03870 [Elainellaceae cyanobacterium]